ncbi:MAG: helix-turn-helix domain-containing protein, partial [Planctomycetes bacterium]|nr:helix-turn-helix domain-containing protein [Planctomycetota bacterium]
SSPSESERCTGVAEWASKSVNCVTGCSHNCRYCYAAFDACDRYHRVKRDEWEHPRVRDHDVRKRHVKYDGTVMFPTTHDITPEVLDPCLQVLGSLLSAGNHVLIVSKPHRACVQAICDRFTGHRSQILFRFTIGADDPDLLRYWDPGAPDFAERLTCLKLAHRLGFNTSVSMEPMLDIARAPRLVRRLLPHITESIWLGKMNNVASRVRVETEEDRRQVDAVTTSQTDEAVWALYDELKDIQQVRWKDSIKKVVGISLQKEPPPSTSSPKPRPPGVTVTEFHVPVTDAAPSVSSDVQAQVVDALAALGHPKRLRIVLELARAGGVMGFTELRTGLGLRAVTLSQQLDVLEGAGVARRVRKGRTVSCRLDDRVLNEVGTYVVGLAKAAATPSASG